MKKQNKIPCCLYFRPKKAPSRLRPVPHPLPGICSPPLSCAVKRPKQQVSGPISGDNIPGQAKTASSQKKELTVLHNRHTVPFRKGQSEVKMNSVGSTPPKGYCYDGRWSGFVLLYRDNREPYGEADIPSLPATGKPYADIPETFSWEFPSGNSKKIRIGKNSGKVFKNFKKKIHGPGNHPGFQIFTTFTFTLYPVSLPVTGSHERM